MRNLLAFAVLVALQAPNPLPGQATRGSKDTGSRSQQEPSRKDHAPQATAVAATVNPDADSPSTQSAGDNVTNQNSEYSVKLTGLPPVTVTDKEKTFWDHVFDWGPWVFNLLLVIVGFIGARLACLTLCALREQKDLQARAIDLQERQMRQWVNYGGWSSTASPEEAYTANGEQRVMFLMAVQLTIENRTAFPLSLPDSTIAFSISKDNRTRYLVRRNTILLPGQPKVLKISFPLTEEEFRQFASYGLSIWIEGDLSFIGTVGKLTEQKFIGYLKCGSAGADFEEVNPEGQQYQSGGGQTN